MKSGRRIAALAAFAMVTMVALTAAPAGAEDPFVFQSTNELNREAGAAHVELISAEPGNLSLRFSTKVDAYALMEFRIDGEILESGTTNWVTKDILYPYICVEVTPWLCAGATSVDKSFAANATVDVRLAITDRPEWSFDWTTFSVPPAETGRESDPGGGGDKSGPLTKSDCRKGGWEAFSFSNQGHCISFVTTSKDRR